jgi:hypothetical protein
MITDEKSELSCLSCLMVSWFKLVETEAKCKHRSFAYNRQVDSVELGVGSKIEMLLSTESGKECGCHKSIIGDKRSCSCGYGYDSIVRRNSQEIHSERGGYRVILFVSEFMKETILEAVEETHLDEEELIKSVQKVQLILKVCYENGAKIVTFSHEANADINTIMKNYVLSNVSDNSGVMFHENHIMYHMENKLLWRAERGIEKDYFLIRNGVKFDLLSKLVMLIGSEGERRTRIFKIIVGDNVGFEGGYGYDNSKRINSQETHYSELKCRVIFSIIFKFDKEGISETGVCSHQAVHKSEIMVIEKYYNAWKCWYKLLMRSCNGEHFNDDFLVIFMKQKYLSVMLLIMFYLVKFAFLFFVILEMNVFSGSLGYLRLEFWNLESMNGMDLTVIMPLGETCRLFDYAKSKLPMIEVVFPCTFSCPPGGQIKSTHHTIEHPAVMGGQRSPFSSEDG